jgi:long-chain fatty acid transport protein
VPALAVLGPTTAHAGGFYVPEIGPRAVGMAGAQTAAVDDTTAIFHNPAGLAGQDGTTVQVAGSMFFGNVSFFRRPVDGPTGPIDFAEVKNTNRIGGAPFLGVASDFGVRNFAAGVAVYVPFGAHLEYPKRGAQRHVVTGVELRTIYVTPSVAYKIADRFSIGAGVSYVFADLALEQANAVQFVTGDPEANPDPDASLEGTSALHGKDPASFSATFGIRYDDPLERFGIGAAAMIPTTLRFAGKAVVRNEQIAAATDESDPELELPQGVRRDDFTAEYPLPLVVRVGAVVRPTPRVSVALDYNYQRWSTFDTLVVDFEHNYELQDTTRAVMYDVIVEQKWHDSHSVRLGSEFQPIPNERIPLKFRVGALFDQSPIDDRHFDVLAPDSDKLGVSVGVGYEFRLGRRVRLGADVGFMHLFFRKRNIGPQQSGSDLQGNDDDGNPANDSTDNPQAEDLPGSDKTVLNKPAPSFYYGVTRAFFDILGVGLTLRV